MEGLTVFWLWPALLVIMAAIFLIGFLRPHKKIGYYLIEPLGLVISSWRYVRSIGNEAELKKLLGFVKVMRLNRLTPLELILADVEKGRASGAMMKQKSIGLMAEQFVIQTDTKYTSIIMGTAEEVLNVCKYNSSAKSLLSEPDKKETYRVATTAAEHGYLALAIATRVVHGSVDILPQHHTYVGVVLLEPLLQEKNLAKVAKLAKTQVKYVSVLPEKLLSWLWMKTWKVEHFQGVGDKGESTPQAQEKYWLQTAVIGSADLKRRYSLVRFLKYHAPCSFASVLDLDKELPITPTSEI